MTGFWMFGGILIVLLATIVWAAFRAAEDTGAALDPAERRDAAIEALRDLELEFRTGKVTEEEYRAVRARLERAALEARDAATVGHARADAGGAGGGGADSAAAMTRAETSRVCTACSADLEGAEAFCPACGVPTGD